MAGISLRLGLGLQRPAISRAPAVATYFTELTIAAGEVSSDLTDYPVYVDFSDLPAGF
ncbi:hypothetical protein LJR255_003816 [Pararhizobium sp. LjRoot255]|uniref:hypothetical protein n=1 Tax=Pararhizobium sp. LjRoot255 TaxID=3342298 RepID=UPI003ECC821D